jgi:hypothetical protein
MPSNKKAVSETAITPLMVVSAGVIVEVLKA